MEKIKQEHYGDFEIDDSEKDVVQFVQVAQISKEMNITFIERSKLPELIKILTEIQNKKK